MNKILVIGGTGTVGGQVVSQLAAAGVNVRALVRNRAAARLPDSVDVCCGDLTVPQTLDPACARIDAVFLVWTAPPSAVATALRRITRLVPRIVFLSAPIKTAHPLFQQPNPLRVMVEHIEKLIETSGVSWTFLRPGMFAANALSWWAPQTRAGDVVRWPYLAVPTAPIDERDIAAVAVRALCEDRHSKAEYVLTGPESLSQFEQISAIARVLGRSFPIQEISPDEARRELISIMPLPAVNMLLTAWSAAAGHSAHVTSTFSEIIGAAPRSFRDWAIDHSEAFRPSRA